MGKIDRRSFMKITGTGAAALCLGLPLKSRAGEEGEKTKKDFRIITVEEHFSTPEHLDLIRAIMEKKYSNPKVIAEEEYISSDAPFIPMMDIQETRDMVDRLMDTGEGRLEVMNKFDIDMQVLSLVSPGVQVLDANSATTLATEMNNRLSRIVSEHPSRFAGLACLAPQSPDKAADELERSVKELGLKGACINSHTKGEYLDHKKFRVIFHRASKLNVPIYLHPRAPSSEMIKPHLGYPLLDSAMWGFGSETGLHAMRLICSGIFDEYENLKIILGHLGEAIPFWLWRIDNFWGKTPLSKNLKKIPSRYFKDNYSKIVQNGQIRHLPGGVYWEMCVAGRDTYQNGAYWATPTGWFVYTLDLVDSAFADKTVIDMVNDFKKGGVCEWILGEKRRLPNYLASASLPLAGIRAMI